MRDLVVNFILNTCDVIIFYYLYCGLTNIKRDFSKKNIILGVVWGAMSGICVNFLRADISRILIYLSIFACIYLLSRKGVFKALIIFVLNEMENALAGVYLSVNSTDNLSKVREDINEYFSIIGINPGKPSIATNDKNRIFNDFIQYKKQEKLGLKKLYFDTEINYYEPHAKVSEPAMIIMLGILLDNAIQMSASGKTIKINIRVTEEYLAIEVANVLLQPVGQDLLRIFEKGYTTQKQDSEIHGYGLSKLSEIVTRYGGEILIKEEYIKADRSDYIFITTEFK